MAKKYTNAQQQAAAAKLDEIVKQLASVKREGHQACGKPEVDKVHALRNLGQRLASLATAALNVVGSPDAGDT